MIRDYARDHRVQVLAIVLLGLLAKLAIARDVAVNGDTGLYLHDAMQLLDGKIMFVDFPSRSPLFEHLLALAIWLGDSPLLSARALMIGISVGLGLAIYHFARQIFDHRTGIAAALIFYLTPFSWVWGVWVKTEQAATLLVVLGFIAAVHHLDRDRIPPLVMAGIGATFGLAFLIRRTAIVHIGAFALFVLWFRYRDGHALRSTVTAAAGTVVAALATLAVGYLATAHGNPGLAWAIADQHAIALIQSGGQGSLGWVALTEPTSVFAEDRQHWFFQYLCQKCGANTVTAFMHTWLVTLPAVILALVPLRAGLRRFDRVTATYLAPGVFIAPPLYFAFSNGLTPGSLAWLLFALGAFVVWFTAPVEWSDYWTPKAMLPVAVFLALAAGYLYRDRILYTTYFQDLFPFLAVLVAGGVVWWLRENRNWAIRLALAVILVTSIAGAGVHAHPYSNTQDNLDDHWFTVELVDAYGHDLYDRLESDAAVFTAQPLYTVHSEKADPLLHLSRRYYLFRGWPDIDLTDRLESDIATALRNGRAPYAINDSNMAEITNESAAIREALHENYCPVDAPVYNRTGGELLIHDSRGEC